MLDVPTTTPLSPAIAAMSVQERMLAVVRRINPHGDPESGPSVTIADFQQAEETCDLTDSQISVNIGAVKRLARQAAEAETVAPIATAQPWDLYPEYRRERVAAAAAHLAGLIPSETDAFAHLRQANFEAAELGALWDEIHAEAARLYTGQRGGIMARIIVDLTRATDAFERQNIFQLPAMAELGRSARVALAGVAGEQELPRRHVLQTLKQLVTTLAESSVDPGIVERARNAQAALAEMWSE